MCDCPLGGARLLYPSMAGIRVGVPSFLICLIPLLLPVFRGFWGRVTDPGLTDPGQGRRLSTGHLAWFSGVALIALGAGDASAAEDLPIRSQTRLDGPFVVAQLPAGSDLEKQPPVAGGMLRGAYGLGARLLLVSADGSARVLSRGFHSACDPDVSFDAARILFAAKRSASDPWNIYEMAVDGSGARQITKDLADCRSPGYQSSLYTLKPVGVPSQPEYQITFVAGAGTMNEYGDAEATHLYSCKLDGSAVRRLTFNLSGDTDPFLMDDGRLLFAGWQRARLDHGLLGRVGIFGVNLDGADFALYAGHEGRRIKQMPCATESGLVVFVEADRLPWDGAGCLASVRIRRPLHSYRAITQEADGLFHSPSPLPDGRVLVSRRPRDGSGTHAVWRLDPSTGEAELVFDDPRYHEIQAKRILKRDEPDGRSSVVTEKDPHGRLYCLNLYVSDLEDPSWMPPGSVKRLRVLEGVPLKTGEVDAYLPLPAAKTGRDAAAAATFARYPGSTVKGIPPVVERRILGEIPVEADGSFNIEVPANTPIELQILDADGIALRSCGWIWAKNREPRGCIGCHEDGELVPENLFVDALSRSSIPLTLPPELRRTVDFRRDIAPILVAKCAPCHHRRGKTPLLLDGRLAPTPGPDGTPHFSRDYENLLAPSRVGDEKQPWGEYVHPLQARTSPLVGRLFGRDTSRPWDAVAARGPVKRMPPPEAEPLTEDEKRTIVEWVDVGAPWDGVPGPDRLAAKPSNTAGENK